MPITVQFSLYPLKTADPGLVIEEAITAARATGLTVEVGRASSTVEGSLQQVFAAVQEAFEVAASHGDVALVVTVSNAC